MLPFAIIKDKKKEQKPEPIIWHSRHQMKIHGLEINQPKPKIYSERHPYRETQKNIRDSFDSTNMNEVKGKHIIDLNRQNIKGFRVGQTAQVNDANRPDRDSYKTDNLALKEKIVPNQQDRGSRSVEGNTHEQDDQVQVRQYNFRIDTQQEQHLPTEKKLTFTEQIVNHYGNGIYTERQKHIPLDNLPSIKIEAQQQSLEKHVVLNLHRELGIFENKKEYTDEYVKRYGGMGNISMEEKVSYPAYSSPSNDQVVNMVQENNSARQHRGMVEQSRSSGSWKEGSLQGIQEWKQRKERQSSKGLWKEGSLEGSRQWKQKKEQSQKSGSQDLNGSRQSKRRVKIFSTENLQPLELDPVQSEYIHGSSGDKKSRQGDHENIILEESQVQNYEQREIQNTIGAFVPSKFLKSKYSIDNTHSPQPSAIAEEPQFEREEIKQQPSQHNMQMHLNGQPMSKSRHHKPIFEEYNEEEEEDSSPPIEPIKVKKVVIWGHKGNELPEASELSP